jgi:SNF2 family DNA or RNA helicase
LGSQEQFSHRFRGPIEDGDNMDQLDVLRDRVGPFILRRVKEGVVSELPPKTEMVRAVELTGAQRDLYESIRAAAHGEVRSAIKKRGFAASSITILDALMKLRQVCCDPRLVAVEAAREVDESAKLSMFFALVEQQLAQGRRALVFSQFTTMLGLLARGLDERGIAHLALTGKTTHRQRVVDAFERGEADVFLISLKAGGTGLNLVSADTVIHFDPWWNAAAQMQATDRAYRIGQLKPVFVYNLIVSGSVEERMLHLQRRKRALADTLLQGGSKDRSGLMIEDIDDLFAPLE